MQCSRIEQGKKKYSAVKVEVLLMQDDDILTTSQVEDFEFKDYEVNGWF